MRDFRDYKVWQLAHQLTLEVYAATRGFPKEELYGLTGQIRRACASIPINIAEGCGKDGDAEFYRFLQIAMGSASELEYELQLAKDLQYLSDDDYQLLNCKLIEVRKMLNGLIQRVRPTRTNHPILTANGK